MYCVKHSEEIINKSIKVYNLVTKYKKVSLIKRSCDFKLLEEKAKDFNISNNYVIHNNKKYE